MPRSSIDSLYVFIKCHRGGKNLLCHYGFFDFLLRSYMLAGHVWCSYVQVREELLLEHGGNLC